MAADTTVHGMAGAGGTADTILVVILVVIPVVIPVVADTLAVADIPVAVGILAVADIPVVADTLAVADTWGEDTTNRTECLIPACIASIGH